ncbi:MAG: hypothetical protein ACK55I_20190, partial [bacterium]
GVRVDRVVLLPAGHPCVDVPIERCRSEMFPEKPLQRSVVYPQDGIVKGRVRPRVRGPLGDNRRSQGQAMEGAHLFEGGAVIEVAVQHGLGLADVLVALLGVERAIEHCHGHAARFHALDEPLA